MKIKRFTRLVTEWLKPDGHENLKSPDSSAEFALVYDNLPVGILSLENGNWSFEYAIPFKRQTHIKPLSEFPDLNKVYNSKTLWPFFAFRIPGMNQPQAKELAEEKGITEGDIVKLLDLFGRKSINNPFKLELKEH